MSQKIVFYQQVILLVTTNTILQKSITLVTPDNILQTSITLATLNTILRTSITFVTPNTILLTSITLVTPIFPYLRVTFISPAFDWPSPSLLEAKQVYSPASDLLTGLS